VAADYLSVMRHVMRPVRSLLAAAALLSASLAAACVERPWHGISLDPPSAAPPLEMSRADGAHVTLAEAKGDVVLLYFGYTHCPDVCPTTMADWARAKRALGADTTGVRFIFLSVDPGRDTPESARAYATQFDPAFAGYGVNDFELARLVRDWGIAVYPEGDPRTPDYTVAHPAHTYVVDRQSRLRLMIPPGVRGEELAEDIRRLR
jgi:protein SCO1